MKTLLAAVHFVDHQIGRLIAELDRLGLTENTLIVLTGDQGYQLGEHGLLAKQTLFEGAKAHAAPSQTLARRASQPRFQMIQPSVTSKHLLILCVLCVSVVKSIAAEKTSSPIPATSSEWN